jgi:hypothetical protein
MPHTSFVLKSRRRAAVAALALLPLAALGAGSTEVETSPAPASGVADISGLWRGTSNWEQNTVHTMSSVSMAIAQNDRQVSGTLTFASPAYQGWSGTFSGTVAGTAPDTQFVGTIDVRAEGGDATCTGSAVVSGRSVSGSLRWETSRLQLPFDADGDPATACRSVLRRVALIMSRD